MLQIIKQQDFPQISKPKLAYHVYPGCAAFELTQYAEKKPDGQYGKILCYYVLEGDKQFPKESALKHSIKINEQVNA